MAIDIKVPAAGESITSANVAQWFKNDGDAVKKGEVLVRLDTDKVSNDLEAEADGILKITVNEGEEVSIGTVIGKIETDGSAPAAAPVKKPAAEPAPDEDSGAPVDLIVPAAGESITSANVAQWRKKEGDHVVKGEVLVTLETDKVSNELEAPVTGSINILVPEGEEVPIGKVIARITPGAAPAKSATAPAPAPAAAPEKSAAAPAPSSPEPARQKPDFSAAPSAPEAKSAPVSEGRTTRKKMSMLRRKVATHLVNAQQTAAILTTFNEVDMSAIMRLRKGVQEDFVKKHGVKLGFMSFFIKAVTQALKDVPSINGRIEGTDIIENHFYDIGVAIGTEKGLIVPVLRDCDKKSFAEIEHGIIDYANKGKEGKITIEDLTGGVFTISNGGTYGSLLSTPILNPPQSGILGMHTIQQRPVAVDGQVVIRPMMYLAMSYDHRLVDGKEAVTFLIRIKDALESPERLMLEL
ncbi:MAG: dihydrolipoyllysine-residue succinyltransferase [Akkermansiaceae bacterium]|nr:dihydrolipoyllysine-residue succinyltransferase [Akkermansiaceae bacterium]MDP4646861.1 dihydrolipoyllysine-residue succinyltransferase [Akkermansiaceae bacterium]MDP4721426.1 dihydrolipoyllysine-residue succinyltransferase [Akkermansiaceae bacterium]MDP4778947.1 dihydrolipoyllysine-residue succinyltransferase [Akkermansiaceae bacterium]MDP4845785.1 dihydrolipoyllysine-residue succinyltransferase [Akkermansiaceae bacterium]